MKKVKIIAWAVSVSLIAIIIYQNREFFFAKQSLVFHYLFGTTNTPDFYSILLHLACFLGGFIFALYFWVLHIMKTNKMTKGYKENINNHLEKISALESELQEAYKSKAAGYDEKTIVMNTGTNEEQEDKNKKQ